MHLNIHNRIKDRNPQYALGVLTTQITVKKSSDKLLVLLKEVEKEAIKRFSIDNYTAFENIAASRNAYTDLGRNPNRYAVSSDALIKRILQNKGLYFINNIVEINNLISIQSGFSVGSYDIDKTKGEINFRLGIVDEKYKGIGKAEFELNNLPLLADGIGPFGSPTSDSERCMITEHTKEIAMIIYSFSGKDSIANWLNVAEKLLNEFADAKNSEKHIY